MSYYDLWVFPLKYPLTKLVDQNIYRYKGLWIIRDGHGESEEGKGACVRCQGPYWIYYTYTHG